MLLAGRGETIDGLKIVPAALFVKATSRRVTSARELFEKVKQAIA